MVPCKQSRILQDPDVRVRERETGTVSATERERATDRSKSCGNPVENFAEKRRETGRLPVSRFIRMYDVQEIPWAE